MIKVEALKHIPHHLAYQKVNETGIFTDIFINEVWDNSDAPPPPPPPPFHRAHSRSNRAPRAPADDIGGQTRAAGQVPAPASNFSQGSSSKTISRYLGVFGNMALRAQHALARNAYPNLGDLLAFFTLLPKLALPAPPVATAHASIVFEQDGPTLGLLPSIDCRYSTKASIPVSPIAVDVTPLPLAPLTSQPAIKQVFLAQTIYLLQLEPLLSFLPSPPSICTMPPTLPITEYPRFDVFGMSQSMATSPHVEGAYSLIRRPLAERVASYDWKAKEVHDAQKELDDALNKPNDPRIDQLLPLVGMLPNLNITVYVRRNARIRDTYNGKWINPVARANDRVAAQNKTGSCSNNGSKSRPKKKLKKLEEIVEMPILATPQPTPKKKIKELANFCGLDEKSWFLKLRRNLVGRRSKLTQMQEQCPLNRFLPIGPVDSSFGCFQLS
uniref:Uncharacterized protein n=1 Tax=Oryza glumipatula TaxID=40148 RepID=A0A0E0BRY1_9ORYZ